MLGKSEDLLGGCGCRGRMVDVQWLVGELEVEGEVIDMLR